MLKWLKESPRRAWAWLNARNLEPPSKAFSPLPLSTYRVEIPDDPERAKLKLDVEKLILERQKFELDQHRAKIEWRKMELEDLRFSREFKLASFKATFDYAKQAIGLLFLLNGGAAVAILARSKDVPRQLGQDLALALKWFGAGCLAAAFCGAASYLSQAWFTGGMNRAGLTVQIVAVIVWVVGVSAFVRGTFLGAAGLQ